MAIKSGEYWSVPGVVATGDLSSYQYYVVKHGSTAGTCKVATTAATDTLMGILQNDPANGEAAEVACDGIVYALAETSVTAGSAVTCSSTGRVKTTTTNLDQIIGFAMTASSAAGDKVVVHLSRGTLADS